MDIGTVAGDVYYGLGMELMPDHEIVGRIAIKVAWGFYRSAENLEGMKKCEEFLKDDLSSEAKALAIEQSFDKLGRFREVMETESLGQKLMNDPDGPQLLKIKLKPVLRENFEDLIRFLESK